MGSLPSVLDAGGAAAIVPPALIHFVSVLNAGLALSVAVERFY